MFILLLQVCLQACLLGGNFAEAADTKKLVRQQAKVEAVVDTKGNVRSDRAQEDNAHFAEVTEDVEVTVSSEGEVTVSSEAEAIRKRVEDERKMATWNALEALAQQRKAIRKEVHSLNSTGDLTADILQDRSSRIRYIHTQMDKCHQKLGLNQYEKRQLLPDEWVEIIINGLERSRGPHGAEFKACVKMVDEVTDEDARSDLTKDWDNLLAKLGPKCKETKGGDAHPNTIDCDLLSRQMSLQKKFLGKIPFKKPKGFCAVLVDAALPVDDEPPCLRFMEDVTHEFIGDGGVVLGWPGIIGEDRFDKAFHEACEMEEHALPAHPACEERLAAIHKLHAEKKKYTRLPDVLVDLCPVMGFPFEEKHMLLTDKHSLLTSRGQTREAFRRAAHKAHGSVQYYSEEEMERSASGACCDKRAYTVEVGVSVSGGPLTLGADSVHGWGYRSESGDTCRHGTGDYVQGSIGITTNVADFDPDIGFAVAFGHLNDIDDIPGKTIAKGWEICFIFCFAGGHIEEVPSGRHIAWYVEISISVGAMPDLGVGASLTYTSTHESGRRRHTGSGSFRQCPSCFPGSSSVQTSTGMKRMSDLRVGDSVLAVDSSGKMIFDDVYFFGHADASKELAYRVLKLSATSTPLTMSARHFLYKCPVQGRACLWQERVHTYAKDVVIGDYVWAAGPIEAKVSLQKVLVVSEKRETGIYNPYTLSGAIVVNGAVASAHSDWILDDVVPESWTQYLPYVYQAFFLPGRWLYYLGGSDAANFLDVNSPQSQPETYGKGPHFLAFCVVVCVMFLWMLPLMLSRTKKHSTTTPELSGI